jgi:hypothetical protein
MTRIFAAETTAQLRRQRVGAAGVAFIVGEQFARHQYRRAKRGLTNDIASALLGFSV